MERNMRQWLEGLRAAERKKALPILSFPAVQLMGISVRELISDSARQAEAMRLVAERTAAAAAVSLMDLSVEAECFGAEVVVSEDEVPTVRGSVVSTPEEVEALRVPAVGGANGADSVAGCGKGSGADPEGSCGKECKAGSEGGGGRENVAGSVAGPAAEACGNRTGIYIEAIRRAKRMITDRPVFAGMIGPYSLAGRLADVTEIMYYCYDEPEMVAALLDKATEFLIAYGKAYKEAGADGIMLAEPLAGLLSPALAEEFSAPYVKRIVEALQDESFLIIYHNCGNCAIQMIESILDTGAAAYHFGNSIDMARMLPLIPEDTVVMGNVDPAGQFRNGTPESIRRAVWEILESCGGYPNFVISSGCDIPPMSRWENINAFFEAVAEYYGEASAS